MKKTILTFILALIEVFSYAQANHMPYIYQMNFDKYEITDSLPIERVMIHFNKEIDNKDFISLGDGDYLAPTWRKEKMVIKTTSDKTKAIIIHNSHAFGWPLEFNVEDNERRTVFWYEDKRIYCGYVYDKEFKVCKYFESRKEFKRFIKRPIFRTNGKKIPNN